MSKRFLADPITLRQEGNKEISQSHLFANEVGTIYRIIDELPSSYVSPAAKVIESKIRMKKNELDLMTKTINEYGEFLILSANTVDKNEQNIIDSYTNR